MRTTESIYRIARGLGLFTALSLADCTSDRLADPSPAAPNAQVAAAAQPVPSVNMAGRWRLVSAGGGACGMTFAAPAGAAEGTIAPEGGCPENFFTSRRWLFDQGALVIRDHTGKSLTQLRQESTGRFEGKTEKGELVWLER